MFLIASAILMPSALSCAYVFACVFPQLPPLTVRVRAPLHSTYSGCLLIGKMAPEYPNALSSCTSSRDAQLAQPNIVPALVLGSIHVEVNQATSGPGLGRTLFWYYQHAFDKYLGLFSWVFELTESPQCSPFFCVSSARPAHGLSWIIRLHPISL